MNSFYYSTNPTVAHNEKHWDFTLKQTTLSFISDNGVFSKNTIDYGSRLLIENTNLEQIPAGPILDLGCGYGPIGLFLARQAPNRQFLLTDVNQRALSLATRNARANQLENVLVKQSDGYQALSEQFAAIVTNPPVRAGKAVVTRMLAGAYDHLLPQGTITVVLQKKQGAPSAQQTLKNVFGNVRIVKRSKGYYILVSERRDGSKNE
ncbi:Ribosomal RNA small subunit methyltransferase C [Fructilactobacillus florum 8D]|uniref:Ribosomal RNA small subunit methyltransferase C n=1 Tax=Fructilactobacillus florum 8D TaxID=1221538 RepID=W9EG91_9LACO|nr:class I SAM-dependent methyltransferase [Fructilactobacillus florum]ETO40281.1 Ribosomal RNA small subunit methyltransferase C [Fructilactobacillus florum 8D]